MLEFTLTTPSAYLSTTGDTIRKVTGKLRALYLNNDWVLFNKSDELVDWDYSLTQLLRRHNAVLKDDSLV